MSTGDLRPIMPDVVRTRPLAGCGVVTWSSSFPMKREPYASSALSEVGFWARVRETSFRSVALAIVTAAVTELRQNPADGTSRLQIGITGPMPTLSTLASYAAAAHRWHGVYAQDAVLGMTWPVLGKRTRHLVFGFGMPC